MVWLLSGFSSGLLYYLSGSYVLVPNLQGVKDLPGLSSVQLCGPMGCAMMFRSKSLIVCPQAWDVEREVFVVLTWCKGAVYCEDAEC